MLTLRRSRADSAVVDLDPSQRAVVDHRGGVLRVWGAPGTGKSTVAVEAVADRVRRGELSPDQCLLLGPTRLTAAALRDRVTARTGGTGSEPLARTHQSFGFGILRQAAALRGDPPPRLLSGPEQDVILRELLSGHAAGLGRGPGWPSELALALGTRAFRGELRDLLMRAVELGLEPEGLAALGRECGRPEWEAAARVLAEYDEVTALSAPGAFDPAWILGAAADLLEDDEEARRRVCGGLRLVVVDDAQELTVAGDRLLSVVLESGVEAVLLGDPDTATQTFRGADPRLFALGWTRPGVADLTLSTGHRTSAAVRRAVQTVSGHIGVLGGAGHRVVRDGPGDEDAGEVSDGVGAPARGGAVEVHLLRAVAQEAAFIAGRVREEHLLRGRPWSDLAVIVRGRARTSALRRVLQSAGVPVAAALTDLPMRDEVAVRPLLTLLKLVLDLARRRTENDAEAAASIDPETVIDLLLSPVGGADSVSLRRLRRALRAEELAAGGGRRSDDLLVEAVLVPSTLTRIGPEGRPARAVGRALTAGLAAAGPSADPAAGGGQAGSVEDILWAIWSATGLAGRWRESALRGGVAGARADRDLDAVLALFSAAAAFVDRLPQSAPSAFLDHVLGRDIPGDTLVARAPDGEAVAVLTPAAAVGREWPVVIVAGVQEGVWPDLRLRGSVLGSAQLVDVVAGRPADWRSAQAAVRHDELRLFLLAVSRARDTVVVTAVRSDDEQPSPLLDLVDPCPPSAESTGRARPFTDVQRPWTLPALVGALRLELLDPDPARRGAAFTGLLRLARAGVRGADPGQWWSLRTLSDTRPRRPGDSPVRVSPSGLVSHETCPLQWFLDRAGCSGPALGSADLGTLVHEIAHELGDTDADAYRAAVDERWGRWGFPSGWVGDQLRRRAHGMVGRLALYVTEQRRGPAEGPAEGPASTLIATEAPISARVGRAEIAGQVDRVERVAGGGIRIIDLKTGSTKPTKAEVARHPQLGAYQLAIAQGCFAEYGDDSAGAALLHLGKAAGKSTTLGIQPPLAQDEDPQWAQVMVAEAAEAMAGASFRARPEKSRCDRCVARRSCPARGEGRSI